MHISNRQLDTVSKCIQQLHGGLQAIPDAAQRASEDAADAVVLVCLLAWCLTALSVQIGYIVP